MNFLEAFGGGGTASPASAGGTSSGKGSSTAESNTGFSTNNSSIGTSGSSSVDPNTIALAGLFGVLILGLIFFFRD